VTRAFVAIRPADDVLAAIAARLASVDLGNGRPARRDQWHLTLQFLGDDADVDTVARALTEEPFRAGPGRLQLGGADTIGNPRRARFLVLGVREGGDWVDALAAEVEGRLAPLGYARERRDEVFLPHLTLARHRTPADLRRVCASIGPEPVGPAWTVDEIVLFESELRTDGARHSVSARVPLRAPQD
jgi:2'-5' RNA ligase